MMLVNREFNQVGTPFLYRRVSVRAELSIDAFREIMLEKKELLREVTLQMTKFGTKGRELRVALVLLELLPRLVLSLTIELDHDTRDVWKALCFADKFGEPRVRKLNFVAHPNSWHSSIDSFDTKDTLPKSLEHVHLVIVGSTMLDQLCSAVDRLPNLVSLKVTQGDTVWTDRPLLPLFKHPRLIEKLVFLEIVDFDQKKLKESFAKNVTDRELVKTVEGKIRLIVKPPLPPPPPRHYTPPPPGW